MANVEEISIKIWKKVFFILVFASIFICIISIFILITRSVVVVLPYDKNSTKVDLNRPVLQQSLKLAGIDSLTIRPSVIVKVSSSTPHPEKLLRFQRTAPSPEGFIPSFGCAFNYSRFTRRIIFLNLYVRGGEYLGRIENETERTDMINRSAMRCLINVISPTYQNDKVLVENIFKDFDLLRNEKSNIFEFRTK